MCYDSVEDFKAMCRKLPFIYIDVVRPDETTDAAIKTIRTRIAEELDIGRKETFRSNQRPQSSSASHTAGGNQSEHDPISAPIIAFDGKQSSNDTLTASGPEVDTNEPAASPAINDRQNDSDDAERDAHLTESITQELHWAFEKLDRNGDGSSSMYCRRKATWEDRLICGLDDIAGLVSRREFIEGLRKNEKVAHIIGELTLIALLEVPAHLATHSMHTAGTSEANGQKLNAFFGKLDSNHDAFISLKELQQHLLSL